MKTRFVKITYTDFGGEKELHAYLYGESTDMLYYMNMKTGELSVIRKAFINTEQVLRGYTPEAKKLAKEYVKAEQKAKELEKQAADIRKPYCHIKTKLATANGVLNEREFVDELKKNGIVFDDSADIYEYNGIIHINVYRDIARWFGESSFTFREYDGTVMLTTDCEKDKNYKEYLKQYGRKVTRPNIKSKYVKEYLDIGDKEILSYIMAIDIETTKALTKEYAKELASKIKA